MRNHTLPGGSHAVRVELSTNADGGVPWGASAGNAGSGAPAITVLPTVGGVSPAAGSAAGGQSVTLYGSGFDAANLEANSITIGGVPCKPSRVATNASALVCITGAVDDASDEEEAWPRNVSATVNGVAASVPASVTHERRTAGLRHIAQDNHW